MIRIPRSAALFSHVAILLSSTSAWAQLTISTDTTSPVRTSTAVSGAPADIEVTEDGTIDLAGGDAITVDSNNAVTMDGAISVDAADNSSGIHINSGTNSTINIGEDATISITEDYTIDDDDRIVTTGISSASNRYGIYVDGDANGTILNEGTISVEGQNSGGIVLNGNWTGDITSTSTGSIVSIGDYAAGISTKAINGNLTVRGPVSVVGYGATAISVDGDVTGTALIQGAVTKGYSYTGDDGNTYTLSRAALRTGTPAVSITGNVSGGIYVAVPPSDDDSNNDDEDNDGIDDSEEGSGSITTYGNGPALQIGGANDITIGAVNANAGTYSLAIEGSVSSSSYYSNTDAYGVVIGGQGGNVTLTDGIGVSGSISATTYDSNATALLINNGSTVTKLYNSGTISAGLSSPGEGTTTAIRDLSGTLTTLENTGYISASGSSTDIRTAIDLSANTTGVTINQYLNADDAETRADYEEDNDEEDPTVYASITGDIRLGSGNDLINASTGQIISDTYFSGGNDVLTLSDNAYYKGDIYWGSGTATATLSGESSYTGTMDFAGQTGTVTINDTATYSGQFSNASNVLVTVNGGTLIPDKATTINFGSLYVASSGTIGVNIDGSQSSTIATNNATFEDGANVVATLNSLATAEGSYTVLTSNNLTINGSLNSSVDTPFIYNGSVSNDSNNIYLTIARKTTDELGLTKPQAAAWDAIYATAQNDDNITDSLLQVEDSETLRSQVAGLLPDHAGGVFRAVTTADRLAARHISDENSLFDITDVGGWLEPVYWRASKDVTDTASYKANGWGFSGGIERKTGLGYFGVSYAWLSSTVKNDGGIGKLDIGQHNAGLFWRLSKGPLLVWSRVGASYVSINSARTYTGTIDDTDFSYSATGKWKGWFFSGVAGASYRFDMAYRFSLKPKIELEQMWLKEKGYAESAGSDAISLTVASRTSKQLSLTPSATASYSLGEISKDWRPLTFQIEAGRREILLGKLGDTTAYFNGGDSYDAGNAFTIAGDSLKGAWIGEASVLAGGYDFTWKISARTEQSGTGADYSARASLSVAF